MATATSIVSMPIEPGRSSRVMMDFAAGSLNVGALRSDLAQSSCVRKQWLRRALGSRDESERVLTLALGDFNITFLGDYRLDLLDGGRDCG